MTGAIIAIHAIAASVVEEFVRLSQQPRGAVGYLRYNQASIGRRRMLNDLSNRIHELCVPVLFFHGAKDPLVNPEDSRRAAAALQGSAALMPFLTSIDTGLHDQDRRRH